MSDIRDELAQAIDAAFDDYLPRYSEQGVCVDSNAVAAILPLIRRAQAEALRDAANVAEDWVDADGMNGGEWMPSEWGAQAMGWLHHRADRIEQKEADA